MSEKIYYDLQTDTAYRADGSQIANDNLPEFRYRNEKQLEWNLLKTASKNANDEFNDPETAYAAMTITATAAIDNDAKHYDDGAVSSPAIVGGVAIAAIKVSGLTEVPRIAGRLRLTNDAGETETINYYGYSLASGVYTFTLADGSYVAGDQTPTYSYSVADAVRVLQLPIVKDSAVDVTNKAAGVFVTTMDCDTVIYQELIEGETEISSCKQELQILDSLGKRILVKEIPVKCLYLLDDDGGIAPAPDYEYRTAAQQDVIDDTKVDEDLSEYSELGEAIADGDRVFLNNASDTYAAVYTTFTRIWTWISGKVAAAYMPLVGAAVENNIGTFNNSGQMKDSGVSISSVVGGMKYQGTWNASTNSPSLASGTGTQGYYYIVSADGSTDLDGITDWKQGDWAVYSGSEWQKIDNTDGAITADLIVETATKKVLTDTERTNISNAASHISNTSNPHSVTASQVGNGTAQWNADKLQGRNVVSTAPTNGQGLVWNESGSQWEPGASGHVIQDAGSAMTTRPNLDFIGFTVTDDSGNNATKIEFVEVPDLEFDDGDLAAGVLTITGLKTVACVVDNNGETIVCKPVYGVANTTIDLSALGTLTGTWKVKFAQGTGGAGMANPMTAVGQVIRGGTGGAPEAVDSGNLLTNEITDDADLSLAHITYGALIANKNTALTLTIKLQSATAYLDNSILFIENYGAGDLTVTCDSGVDLNGTDGGSFTLSQYQAATIRRHSEDVWTAPNQTVA